jgi:peroxiredoxin
MFGKILKALIGGFRMPAVTVGKTAPSIELTGVDGESHSLQKALSQGPVLAVFFKVSCPTCQYTLPFIERLYQQLRGKNPQVWGVSQDNARDSQRFAEEYGVTFPILIDDDDYQTSREYGLKFVPTLFLISPDGLVEISSEGFCKADLLEIQRSLAKHLSATPGALFKPKESVPEYKPG